MIFCPKCGAQNPDGSTFCGGCGASISAPAAAAGAPQGAAQHAPNPASAAAGAAPMPTKPRNSMPIVIGGIVVAIVAVLLIVLLVIPRCSGGGAVVGGSDINTLVTGKTSEAQAVLKNMTAVELDAGNAEFTVYASSDKMKKYIEDVYDDATSGDIDDFDDVLNLEKAKEINGEWVLVSTADDDIQDALDSVSGQLDGIDLSHIAVYATVVVDDDLTNEEVANIVSKAGVPYEHASVGDFKVDTLIDFIGDYAKLGMAASYGYGSSSQIDYMMKQVEDMADDYDIARVGEGAYMGKDVYAVSFSVQFKGYAVVAIAAFNPSDFGMGDLVGEEFVSRYYAK